MMTHVANNYRPPPMLKPVVASGHVMPGHAVIAAGHHVVTPGHPVSIIQTLAQPVLQSVPQKLPIVVKPDYQVPLHHQIIMKAAPAPGGTTELARCGMAVKHEAVSIAEIASLQLQQFVKQELQQSQPTVSVNINFNFVNVFQKILYIKLRRSCECFFPLSFGYFSLFSSPNYATQINALSI